MPALVSIGIPICDIIDGFSTTITSLLEQSYGEYEVIIVDDTGENLAGFFLEVEAERDKRLLYIKTPVRFGILPAHAEALSRSKGTYFMWLGVGDRLDPNFIETCVARLETKGDLSLAIGQTRLEAEGADEESLPKSLNVIEADPVQRIEKFLDSKIGLDLWYGVFRRSFIATIPFRNAIGFELTFLAEVAFVGKIETIEDTWSVRGRGQGNLDRNFFVDENYNSANSLGVSAFQFGDPYLVLAVQLFCNIAFLSDNFATLPRIDRLRLAVRAYTKIADGWGVIDDGQFISFAAQLFTEARITDHLHELRYYLAATLYSQAESKALFDPLSRAEEIMNGLYRIKIGQLSLTQKEREIISMIRNRFDLSKSENFKNRAVLALALFL
jgi:glycosyltransferase involved in cell wall biosynthesis